MLPLPDFAPSSEKDVGFWPEATLRQMIHSAAGDDPLQPLENAWISAPGFGLSLPLNDLRLDLVV
jgi:hypothetical protein